MMGVREWRKRVTEPNPGRSAKSVGDALRLALRRFVCCTSFPPLNWLRIQKLLPSTFPNETDGVTFSELWRKLGSEIPVCQSIAVEYVLAKTVGFLLDESFTSITTRVAGALDSRSLKLNELVQLKPPILMGVLKLELLFRWSTMRRTLSGSPLELVMYRYVNSVGASLLRILSVWKLKPGDQSNHEVGDSVGTVMLKFGKPCSTSVRPGCCVRVPPRLSEAGPILVS